MRSAIPQNNFNIEQEYISFQNKIISFAKNKFASEDFVSNSIATLLHLTVIFFLFFSFSNKQAQPVLSFTVTMMDVSSSSKNVVATKASAASQLSSKESTMVNENGLTKVEEKNHSKNESVNHSGNKANQSYDSIEQFAVLSNAKASYDASYLNNPAPRYPAISKINGEQGTVLLDVMVNSQGVAESVKLNKSSGFSKLDDSALTTVRKWKFVPAKNGDKFVSSYIQVPIKFILEQ